MDGSIFCLHVSLYDYDIFIVRIELDKKWYEDRMYSLAEDLKNID